MKNEDSDVISTLGRFQTQFAKTALKDTIEDNIGSKKIVYLAEQALIFKLYLRGKLGAFSDVSILSVVGLFCGGRRIEVR